MRDELERSARTGRREEANGTFERRRVGDRVAEQRALDVRERGMRELAEARRQLLDAPVGERAQIVHRRPQRLERGPPRLVRHRDGDLGAPGERAQQLPLGAGEVLEAVREDGLVVPRVEVGRKPLDGAAAKQVAVPAAEPVELGAVRAVEPREVAVQCVGLEQPRLELGEGRGQGVGEAGEAGRAPEPVQRGVTDDPPDEQAALRVLEQRPRVGAGVGQALEDVVEGADRAAQQRRPAGEQVALDAFDVRPVRHDQHGAAFQLAQIALQEECDFARAGRPGDQAETHRPILDRGPDGSFPRLCRDAESGRKERETRLLRGGAGLPSAERGRRPRRATGVPGSFWPQSSHRSACLEPRRASCQVRRMTAPFPSSTSLPHWSHTRIVFRAKSSSLKAEKRFRKA